MPPYGLITTRVGTDVLGSPAGRGLGCLQEISASGGLAGLVSLRGTSACRVRQTDPGGRVPQSTVSPSGLHTLHGMKSLFEMSAP